MTATGVQHIAIVVRDLERARDMFTDLLGVTPSEVVEVADQKANVCFFRVGEVKIELVCPNADNESLNHFLDTRGEGLHHICIGVDDLEKTLVAYTEKGISLIDKTPRIGAEGHKIAFVHPKSAAGVLIELEEND